MEINGLPAHVLVIHAAVVLLPLAALVACVHAVMPRWRWATRWPALVLAVVALGSVVASYFTGRNLRQAYIDNPDVPVPPDIPLHAERAAILLWLTIVFVVFVFIAVWFLGGPSALVSGWGTREHHSRLMEVFVSFMVVALAVGVVAMTVATGDRGQQSVWHDKWVSIKG